MNDKKTILILSKILDKIQQEITKMKERKLKNLLQHFVKKKVFLLNRYSIFCFLMLHLLAINHPLDFRVEIHSRSSDSRSAVRCGKIRALGLKREKTCKSFFRFSQKFSPYAHIQILSFQKYLA